MRAALSLLLILAASAVARAEDFRVVASRRTRIYHAFGEARLRLAGRRHEVAGEAVVSPGKESRR